MKAYTDRGYELMKAKVDEDKLKIERSLLENGFGKKSSSSGLTKIGFFKDYNKYEYSGNRLLPVEPQRYWDTEIGCIITDKEITRKNMWAHVPKVMKKAFPKADVNYHKGDHWTNPSRTIVKLPAKNIGFNAKLSSKKDVDQCFFVPL